MPNQLCVHPGCTALAIFKLAQDANAKKGKWLCIEHSHEVLSAPENAGLSCSQDEDGTVRLKKLTKTELENLKEEINETMHHLGDLLGRLPRNIQAEQADWVRDCLGL